MGKHGARLAFLACLIATHFTHSAQSHDWPQRPVKILAPFAAGGNGDIISRIVAQRLSEVFGQPFVVEPRPGAGGAIAAEAVARAPPDGHTLFMGNTPVISIAPVAGKTPYHPERDFAPISAIGTNPLVFVVHPGIPARTLCEFVDHARRNPSKLTYAASGAGTLIYLSTMLFLKRAGIDMTQVNYRGGGAPPVSDVIAGHVDAYFANLSVVLPHATSGNLRLLAVSSERRVLRIPDVPTFIESGYPDLKIRTWNGLMAPTGTPKEVVRRIAEEVARAVKDPTIAARLGGVGVDPLGNDPEEFAAMIAADIGLWTEAVKIAGVQVK
jgi:tripartite-type tricarboxylate transporter receptor subunit TctC